MKSINSIDQKELILSFNSEIFKKAFSQVYVKPENDPGTTDPTRLKSKLKSMTDAYIKLIDMYNCYFDFSNTNMIFKNEEDMTLFLLRHG